MLPTPRSNARLLSVVIPAFNEALVLPFVRRRLLEVVGRLPMPVEIIFVNDGSTDRTLESLLAWAKVDPRVKVVDFGRNFGQQLAITAGLDVASGDAVVVMDCDLQDPPELIPSLLERYHAGFDVVMTKRTVRHGEHWLKKLTAKAFGRMMRAFSKPGFEIGESDFCLLSSKTVLALRDLKETHRFMRGLVGWLGHPVAFVEFEREARKAGATKYTVGKMIQLALDGAFSFSAMPMRVVAGFGLLLFGGGIFFGGYGAFRWLRGDFVVPVGAALAVVECLIGGATLFLGGMIGEYVLRIYEETKRRPLYVVRSTRNFESPLAAAGDLGTTEELGRSVVRELQHHFHFPEQGTVTDAILDRHDS